MPRMIDYARSCPLAANTLLFVAGFYWMPNGWWQLCALLALLVMQLVLVKVPDVLMGLREDRWLQGTAVYLLAGLVGSYLVNPADASTAQVIRWTGGAALLMLFLLMVWQTGGDVLASRWMGKLVVWSGAATGVGSVLIFYFIIPDGVIGDRLRNWFVYGGLHPVCAGIMWGFAATWAACRWNDSRHGEGRGVWRWLLVTLLVVTLFTLSRGALLSTIAGHCAMLLVRGWRKAWRPCALLMAMILAFQVSAPLITRLADLQESLTTGSTLGRDGKYNSGEVVVTQNPVKELCKRGDNGRLDLYKRVLGVMHTPAEQWFGKGLWASDAQWRKGIVWSPEHQHSIFISTYFHHGFIGLAALLSLLAWGLWRCVLAARAGEDLWIILSCYGVMALTFDGHSMQTLVSIPRFEALVLWLPLAMGCAASYRLKRVADGRYATAHQVLGDD